MLFATDRVCVCVCDLLIFSPLWRFSVSVCVCVCVCVCDLLIFSPVWLSSVCVCVCVCVCDLLIFSPVWLFSVGVCVWPVDLFTCMACQCVCVCVTCWSFYLYGCSLSVCVRVWAVDLFTCMTSAERYDCRQTQTVRVNPTTCTYPTTTTSITATTSSINSSPPPPPHLYDVHREVRLQTDPDGQVRVDLGSACITSVSGVVFSFGVCVWTVDLFTSLPLGLRVNPRLTG